LRLKTTGIGFAFAIPQVKTHLAKALSNCHLLRAHGCGSAIGFWNRIQRDSKEVAAEYLASLAALASTPLDCYLSIKPLGLAFRRDLLMDIVLRARRIGLRVHFDSPTEELCAITFSTIDEVARLYSRVGCTLPGRWHRSLADADWAIARGLCVRVVKGQWADPNDPARDAAGGFLALIDRLAGRARHVAVATHDASLMREAVARLRAAGTPCEVELLVEDPWAMQAARQLGVPVRGYVPYGDGTPLYHAHAPVMPPVRATPASWPRLSLLSDARAHA
jgi:proline dehydrogenase